MAARLLEHYRSEVAPRLRERFAYKNALAVPRLDKIVVSVGMGDANKEPQRMEAVAGNLAQITGQKAVLTRAKKSVSNFNVRRGYIVGAKVTLRRGRMYEFLDRLVSLAIPRVKDFRGLNPSSFDGRGNYNMGLVEQTVFPEIDAAKVQLTHGMNITIHTTAETDEEALELLRGMGMPFRES
ncbi:MAG: 50S ribosomal protein L5 [Phycisphaerae bacterium]